MRDILMERIHRNYNLIKRKLIKQLLTRWCILTEYLAILFVDCLQLILRDVVCWKIPNEQSARDHLWILAARVAETAPLVVFAISTPTVAAMPSTRPVSLLTASGARARTAVSTSCPASASTAATATAAASTRTCFTFLSVLLFALVFLSFRDKIIFKKC